MSQTSEDLIVEEVVSTARRVEDMDDVREELDPLDVHVDCTLDGTVRGITAVLTTGGPHIEVALYDGRVDGYWDAEEHTALVMDEETEAQLEALGDHYRRYFEEAVLA